MVMFGREALDPEILEAVRDVPDFVFSAETVPMMRQNAVFAPVAAPDIERTELTTEPDGGVSMTVLRPRDAVGDLPVLYWMHGGGTVIGNRFMDDARLGAWCRLLSCVCVSVEYRLAPEAPYPAAIDDCDQGLRYIVDHAAELRLDPHRIGVGGRSAGGGLAAALALRWRDRADGRLAFQYLEYPMLDDRMNTPSSKLDGLPVWSRESNAFGWHSLPRRPLRDRRRSAGRGAGPGGRVGGPTTDIHHRGHRRLPARRGDRLRREAVPRRSLHRASCLRRRRTWLRYVRRLRGCQVRRA